MKKIYKGALIAALLITMIATLFLPIFSIMDHEISLADFVYNVLQNTSNSLAELLQNQYTDYAIGVIILCVLFIAVLCLVIKIESITAYYIAIAWEIIQVVAFSIIYLAAKRTPKYDSSFENYLFKELVWLDRKIVSNLDADTRQVIASNGFYNHNCRFSQYYWNDMMRKIVIAQVVPLCISSEYKTRALQLLNYADNRIFNLVNVLHLGHEDSKNIGIQDYRIHKNEYNQYDYQNDFFVNLDSIGVQYVKRLAYRMKNPLCDFDYFLNERSYTDLQYLHEIIGTQLIASMHYEEAIKYLRLVSDAFAESRNTYPDMKYNPFGRFRDKIRSKEKYKLKFAQTMYALEGKIANAKNPDDKADYMLSYARGLQNSIGECWTLTAYYWGDWICFPFYSYYQKKLRKNIAEKAEEMKEKAFRLYVDPERAARACYDWDLFKTAMTNYPNTKVAEFIRGHCDEWVDYK